ncbi:MAG TPA: class I adenylate-forming enzyme family protein [Acidimicrobiales bacterium]|nr:class I adenylate-forming enzyme family protein [Acidimicrobiales bacterium]
MPSFFDVVAGYTDKDPDRLALLTEQDGTRTYGELTARAAALGAALHVTLGVEPGSRVCIWAVNRPEWVETYLAAGAVQLATVAANPEWTDTEAAYVLEHSESVVVVCDADLAARAVALAERIPGLRWVVALVGDDGAAPAAGAQSYEALVAGAGADGDPRAVFPTGEGPPASFLMYTSGTSTGRPKAVVSRPTAASMSIDYQAMFGLNPSDRAIVVTPFFHGNGFGGVTSALAYGGSAVFPRRFSARRFWPLVDRYRPTYLMTLAPIVNILLGQHPGWHERTHAFRVLIVLGSAGGAPVIEERFGVPVIDWYGMTEAGMGTYTRLDEPRKVGSAGRPFPGSGMTILKDGAKAAPGEIGEVVFRRESLGFEGYLKDDEANQAALDDQYFHTGDLGYFDEEGYFFFVDRLKDIVRRGGENISSMEVEAVLRTHPEIAEAAVVGKPDPVLGERVVAFVRLADGVDALSDPEAVKTFVAAQLAPFKVPEALHVVDELPRTPTGKIQKFQLRQQLS